MTSDFETLIKTYGEHLAERDESIASHSNALLMVAMSEVVPISTLPYAKEDIRRAIEAYLEQRHWTESEIDILLYGYCQLAHYVPDHDAEMFYQAATEAFRGDERKNSIFRRCQRALNRRVAAEEVRYLEILSVSISRFENNRQDIAYALEVVRQMSEGAQSRTELCDRLDQD